MPPALRAAATGAGLTGPWDTDMMPGPENG